MGLDLSTESQQVLVAFGGYVVGVMVLGAFAHRYLQKGSFVQSYFLGNRGLGPWVLALTVAATAVSGGTFMGFPSLIYSNGWVMALWIASYMVVPLTTLILLGKRLNQVARVSGAVTVPDVFRDRFDSPLLGLTATLMILVFLAFNLVAQFKAGGLVMKEALRLMPPPAAFVRAEETPERKLALFFRTADGRDETLTVPLPTESARYLPGRTVVDGVAREVRVFFDAGGAEPATKRVRFPAAVVTVPLLGWPVEKGYLIGLLLFAFTVVAYTTYGGFWAVTWTDVLEGLVMLVGVVLMAVLAVRMVPAVTGSGGESLTGLSAATEHLLRQDPALVYGPGPRNYLPAGLAFSFFLMWSITGAGQAGTMVRLMSFKDAPSLRRAMLLICGYYVLTYLSLLVIFVCARAIYPTEYLRGVGSEGEPDSIMPAMTRT